MGMWSILKELLTLKVIATLREKMKWNEMKWNEMKWNDRRWKERDKPLRRFLSKIEKVDDMVHAMTMKLYGTFKSVTLITAMNNECI